MTDIVDDLKWHGLLALSTDEDALRKAFADGPVIFYVGFDPTAPSLHFGNLVQMIAARRLQEAGHTPLILIGGSTGLIGDPKPNAERTLNSKETVAEWVVRIRDQVSRFISFEGPNAARVVNNLDWTAPMSAIDFLRDIGKHFRVGKMLSKDAVSARLNSEAGISYTEFSYQVLQGMDYLELYRQYGCTLQTGGSDQWGNITAGVDLIHKAEGVSVHALATPLLLKADGTKFGKTESGTVWLSGDLMTPYAFYQFFLNSEDAMVISYLKVFSFRSREEIEELERLTMEKPQMRAAQKALAEEVTTLVHGAEATAQVIAASKALFGQGDLTELDEPTLRAALSELPGTKTAELVPVAQLLADTGLVVSRGAGRRTINEGGAYVNNRKIEAEDEAPTKEDLLHGRWLVLRRGKRTLGAVEVGD
ncbi:tyrosyl-tRNA synthetase [Catenulispora acidiphila DSM 44928]|uniref:Tyrosine--tRNA ligase n=1 Tax=Catenulispora acidiphila (strain DSM 44928 / JCM 14897 / NBRC 102108 / NRRL B-24433 / ID139908) TaxID=479433 RepID=C7Q9H5_CATAD|nr:tyrosine--tRNA ligase [Catenulispora acidiphila]ACU74321.1 tyrosyl-tRNA synthetase [Catenulispora acidiphila DSM 44928]